MRNKHLKEVEKSSKLGFAAFYIIAISLTALLGTALIRTVNRGESGIKTNIQNTDNPNDVLWTSGAGTVLDVDYIGEMKWTSGAGTVLDIK